MNYNFVKYILIIIFFKIVCPIYPQSLSLNEYLQKVKNKNIAIKKAEASIDSTQTELFKEKLLTSPNFFSQLSKSQDKSPNIAPLSNGNNFQEDLFQVGVEQQTDFGLKGRLYYSYIKDSATGFSSPYVEDLNIHKSSVNLELQFPLWKNSLGEQIKLQKLSLYSQGKGSNVLFNFQKKQEILNSVIAYIQAVKIQESIQVQHDIISQGEKLLNWVKKQNADRLLEEVNVAEAESSLESHQIGLQNKLIALQDIQTQFNNFIHINSTEKIPKLNSLEELEKLIKVPHKFSERKDIVAKRLLIIAEKAQYKLEQESLKPEIEIKGIYSTYQKTNDTDDTSRCTNLINCRTTSIGINFKIPLDTYSIKSVNEGLFAKIKANEFELQQESEEALMKKESLLVKIGRVEDEITVLKRLYAAMNKRLSLEEQRQLRGKSTTFDLIRAEKELAETKDQLINAKASRLEMLTRLKAYEDSV